MTQKNKFENATSLDLLLYEKTNIELLNIFSLSSFMLFLNLRVAIFFTGVFGVRA
jgi:hypothetical protein